MQGFPVGPPLFSDPGESFFGSFFAKKEQKHPPTKKRGPQEAAQGVQNCLFSVDCTGRANALAGAAIDAGTSIDHSLVLHADRTDGAGVNTCTASNALAGNGMSHRELLISVLIDVPYRPCTAAPRYGATAGTGPAALQIVYHIV